MKGIVSLSIVAVAALLTAGCGPKKLTREEAQKLVDAQVEDAFSVPKCHMFVGSKQSDGRYSTITFDDEKCTEPAKALGIVEAVTVEKQPGQPKVALLRVPRPAGVKCAERPDRMCEVTADCGTVKLEVDSITTEDRTATIEYTIRREIPDAVLTTPSNCVIRTSNSKSERKTLVARRTDEGRWIARD